MTDWLIRTFVKGYRETGDPGVRMAYGQFAGIVGTVCNVLLCLAKGAIGLASGSVSIVADAVNNLSDAASNVVSMLGFKLASRPADVAHPYGHGRFEYLAGLVVSVLVTAVGIELARTGIDRVLHPRAVEFSLPLVLVMLLSIGAKSWMMGFNQAIARKIGSETLEATAIDSRNDAATTVGILICAVVSQMTGVALDGWVGLAMGAFVLVSGLKLVADAVNPLLGVAPAPELVDRVRARIMAYPGVIGTHDLMVHDYGPGRRFATAHVEMPAEMSPLESHDALDNLERELQQEEGLVMTLHLDPIVTDDPEKQDLRNWIEEQAEEVAPGASVHDVRSMPGPTHTNILFDLARPSDCALSDQELSDRVAKRVQRRYPEALCKIHVDDSYAEVAR